MAERREINPVYFTLILSALTGSLAYLAYTPPLSSVRPKDEGAATTFAWGDQTELARLWEDPLAIEKPGGSNVLAAKDLEEQINRKVGIPKDAATRTNSSILGVFVEGSPYADDREVRLRIRYATQRALLDAGYVPADRSHLGLLEVAWPKGLVLKDGLTDLTHIDIPRPPEPATNRLDIQGRLVADTNLCLSNGSLWQATFQGAALAAMPAAKDTNAGNWKKLQIPFEWYTATKSPGPTNVLVLWLDEEAFGDKPLERLYLLARQIGASNSPPLSLLGPRSSNTLKTAADGTRLDYESDRSYTNWLASVKIASPEASAPDALLSDKEWWTDIGRTNIESYMTDPPRIHSFTNFIATDMFLATNLVHELILRGVDIRSGSKDDIVLISESDTLYGRSLPTCLAAAYQGASEQRSNSNWSDGYGPLLRNYWSGRTNWPPQVHRFSYLRGLDGKTASQSTSQASTKSEAGKKGTAPEAGSGNRAEGDAQLDYVRRLAGNIKNTIGTNHWGPRQPRAIGVLGSDIYDKLILLQAPRSEFRDAVFFTTDLDARLLDAEVHVVTRNMIVASAYGLLPTTNELKDATVTSITPFRDCYQTAVYLACRNLLGGPASIGTPRLFEIGRTRFVELGASNKAAGNWVRTAWRELVWVVVPVGVLLGLFWWVFGTQGHGRSQVVGHLGDLISKEEKEELQSIQNRRHWWWLWIISGTLLVLLAGYFFAQWQASQPDGEPFLFYEGVSIWPTLLLRLFIIGLSLGLLVSMWCQHQRNRLLLRYEFFGKDEDFCKSELNKKVLSLDKYYRTKGISLLRVVCDCLHVWFDWAKSNAVRTRSLWNPTLIRQLPKNIASGLRKRTYEAWALICRPAPKLPEVPQLSAPQAPPSSSNAVVANTEFYRYVQAALLGNRFGRCIPVAFIYLLVAGLSIAYFGFPYTAARGEPLHLVSGVWAVGVVNLLLLLSCIVGWCLLALYVGRMVIVSRPLIAQLGKGQMKWRELGHWLRRCVPLVRCYFLVGTLSYVAYYLSLQDQPFYRQFDARLVGIVDIVVLAGCILGWGLLAFYVVDAVRMSRRLIARLGEGQTEWPARVIDEIAMQRRMDPQHLNGYLDVLFTAKHTREVYRLTFYPMLVSLLMFVARVDLFDRWTWPWTLILVFVLNTLMMLGCAFLLRREAGRVRDAAIEQLESLQVKFVEGKHALPASPLSLSWQFPRPLEPVAKYNESLRLTLEEIRNLQTGAYAHWPADLALIAALIPTGGAGLIALIQRLFQ